jgi:hypothetical protein
VREMPPSVTSRVKPANAANPTPLEPRSTESATFSRLAPDAAFVLIRRTLELGVCWRTTAT